MTDKLSANKANFLDDLLLPASRLTDTVLLEVEDGAAKLWVTSDDNSVIFCSSIPVSCEGTHNLVIPDIKQFVRLCGNIEGKTAEFEIQSNAIAHKTKKLSFKYHLRDERYAQKRKNVTSEAIARLSFDTVLPLTKSAVADFLRYAPSLGDIGRVYLQTNAEGVFARIGDDTKDNTNELMIHLADPDNYSGKEIETPVCFGIGFLNLLCFPSDASAVTVSVNHSLKVFKFAHSERADDFCYVVSGLK